MTSLSRIPGERSSGYQRSARERGFRRRGYIFPFHSRSFPYFYVALNTRELETLPCPFVTYQGEWTIRGGVPKDKGQGGHACKFSIVFEDDALSYYSVVYDDALSHCSLHGLPTCR